MIIILSFIIGVLFGCGLMYLIVRHSKQKSPAKGIADYMEEQQEEKQHGKEKILKYLEQNEDIANNDVEKLLGISDATASRYLSELEDEGKIEQVGGRGRFVSYRKK